MLQLPPDSQAAILSQTLPEATLGAGALERGADFDEPELELDELAAGRWTFGALVPTRTTCWRGAVVTALEVCLRLVSLPSWRTSWKVRVRLPGRPAVSTLAVPRASEPLFFRTVLKATFSFFCTVLTSTRV